ncbi:uncharacterized protein LOC125315075 [Rhodamnia argentea]|uniref:Uncharacterized protein LOC125315075 n=1 Tax=Rhodamnia argentea TaxID=178133 RepID=A0ABM3HEG3_9MYRT|nr:uncharacterized protein LOC125315075 [Rhodamnia argentea]
MELAFILLLVFSSVSTYGMASISEDDHRDLERQVQMMTKSPMKSFVTKPDISFVRSHAPSKVKSVQFESREPCPVGTVPIPRMTKEDLIRAKSVGKMPSSKSQNTLSQHVVSLRDDMTENIKYGGYGRSNVYKLAVTNDQVSSHNMWIETGPPDHISMIVAGWQGNGYRDGCYNMLYQGFVQVDRLITPGFPFRDASTFDGPQFEFFVQVFQDPGGKSWWLVVGDPPTTIGYWPSELFLYLRNGSLHTGWGGVGLAGRDGVCPPMGSGHRPDGSYTRATFFRQLQWIDKDGTFRRPSPKTVKWVDKSNVYDLKNYGYGSRRKFGYWISFGGPGGYCGGGMDGL